MMTSQRRWMTGVTALALALAVGVTACGKKAETTPTADTATPAATAEVAAVPAVAIDPAKPNACAELKTGNWKAQVNRMPPVPVGGPILKITGEAAPTTLGWAVGLQVGPLDKMSPPNQVVLLRANKPPQGGAAVPPPLPVTLDIPNAQPAYNSVRIVCPGIDDVVLKVEYID